MSAFLLFAIILTVAYVIYYTVVICTDLYRKPRERTAAAVETFEIRDLPDEPGKAVEETDGGFRVSRGGAEPSWDETDLRAAAAPSEPEPESEPAYKIGASGESVSPAEQKASAAAEGMEEIHVEMNGELMSLTMESALTQGRPYIEIEKTVTPADEDGQETKEEKDGDEDTDAE